MKHDEDIIIELSEKVIHHALTIETAPEVDFDYVPFKSFTFFYTLASHPEFKKHLDLGIFDEYTHSISEEYKVNLTDKQQKIVKDKFKLIPIYTTVFINEKGIFLELQEGVNRYFVAKCKILFKNMTPKITFNNTSHFRELIINTHDSASGIIGDSFRIAIVLLNYFQEPNQVVEVEGKRYEPNLNNSTITYKQPSNNTRYLTKKVYKIDDLATRRTATGREFTRHTESWNVRGHWRTYKSGKKAWIEQGIRGDRTKKVKPKQVKLANIEESNKDE